MKALSRLTLCSIAMLLGAFCACAESPDEAAPKADDADPKADVVFNEMSAYLKGLERWQVEQVATFQRKMGGKEESMVVAHAMTVERPDKIAFVAKEGEVLVSIVSDGTTITNYNSQMKRYTALPAPETLESVKDEEAARMLSVANFALALLAENPQAVLLKGAEKPWYGGEVDLDGILCHRLLFVRDEVPWEIWVDAGDRPLPRKVAADFSKTTQEGLEVTVKVELKDWNTAPVIPEDAFVFAPPEDASKVDSLFEPPAKAPHRLTDQPAPDFSLMDLAGETVSLEDYKNKSIVVLDFWATWCPPCVKAMPVIKKVTGAYEEKGVVLLAVNLLEDKAKIGEFLKEHGLDCRVVIDSDGAVASQYGVNSIPQTVIIDRSGVVRVVHVGISPGLEDTLTEDLEGLLAEETEAPVEPVDP